MKYFTPELLNRFGSDDEDVSAAAHDEWDRAIARYKRRMARIKTAFPAEVQRFEQEHICLHDAEVLSIARQEERFVMVMHMEPPSQNLVILTFTLDGVPEIETEVFPGPTTTGRVFWLYEEFHLDRRKRCWFEVQLSNGCVIRLAFRDFQSLVAETVRLQLPGRGGRTVKTA